MKALRRKDTAMVNCFLLCRMNAQHMVHLAPEKRQVTIISIYLCLIYMNTTNHSVPLQNIFVFNQLLKCNCNCINENILIILTRIANIFADLTDFVTVL